MNYFNFPSVVDDGRAFRVDGDRRFEMGFRGCCRWATMYDTYGDGATQHSAEVPFAREMLSDFLGSLAAALNAADDEHRNEMLALLSKLWPRKETIGKDRIRFALKLRRREDKTQYFNTTECKVTTSAGKRHDKRWTEIPTYADNVNGSVQSAAWVLDLGQNSYDDVDCISKYLQICEVFREDNENYQPYNVWQEFKIKAPNQTGNRGGWTETAWNAVDLFVNGYRDIKSAKEQAARWMEHGRPVKESA